MKDKKINELIGKCFTKAQSSKRKCFVEGCNNNAINSHLLQKNGTLSLLAEKQHVWQTSYDKFPKGNYTIKEVGVNNSLTFKGFCNLHDTQIFKSIESGTINFDEYKNLLLLSYRALLKEYRDKETMNDCFRLILKQVNDLKSKSSFEAMITANQYMMWDLEYDMACINEDLSTESRVFHFEVLALPKLEVCCSACFSLVSIADSLKITESGYIKTEPIPAVILNLIPEANETKLILGYNKISEKYLLDPISEFRNLRDDELLKKVSDFIIRSVEIWICSNTFYQEKIYPRKEKIITLLNHFVLQGQFSKEKIDLNLFK